MIQHLHIPKTGGSALAQGYVNGKTIHRNGHAFLLSWLKPGDDAITIVRDPVDRFGSSFGWIATRLREGSPVEWSWPDANALALDIGTAHWEPVAELQVFLPQSHWLDGDLSRLIWVGRTETLYADFERLRDLADLPALPGLPPPGPASNTGLPHGPLSERAKDNIRAWYADDYTLLRNNGWL